MNFGNSIMNIVNTGCSILAGFYVKLIVSISLLIKGIDFGKGCKFYGFPTFFKPNSGIIKIGKNCRFRSSHTSNLIGINRPCIISINEKNGKIIIGDNCGFSGTVIASFNEIIIETDVKCGANTLITDSDWHQEDSRTGIAIPVHIKKNVWLGEGVKVLKGVTIGENAIIGAGSVVTKNIPSNVIAGGNPCRIIKQALN
jgi:acetyltransferase-like isoleucine patch superfamily enzyme